MTHVPGGWTALGRRDCASVVKTTAPPARRARWCPPRRAQMDRNRRRSGTAAAAEPSRVYQATRTPALGHKTRRGCSTRGRLQIPWLIGAASRGSVREEGIKRKARAMERTELLPLAFLPHTGTRSEQIHSCFLGLPGLFFLLDVNYATEILASRERPREIVLFARYYAVVLGARCWLAWVAASSAGGFGFLGSWLWSLFSVMLLERISLYSFKPG